MSQFRQKKPGFFEKPGFWGSKLRHYPGKRYLFNEPVPRTKDGSRPNWDRYLAALAQQQNEVKRKASPLQHRIKSLDVLIEQFEQERRPYDDLKTELQRCLDVPLCSPTTFVSSTLVSSSRRR